MPMQEAAARNADVRNSELDVLLPSGKWLNMLGSASPLRDAQGQVRGCVGAFVDITARKRTEEALRELTRTLESKVARRTAELEHRARQLQKLALELSLAEDRERKRLADILHDDLQQLLAAAKFHLQMLGNRLRHDPSQQEIATKVDQMLKEAIEKSRGLSHELSPAVLYHGNLAETFNWLAGQVQAKHGLVVHVDAFNEVTVQSDALKAFLYKAGQELLFNVVKHARVSEARIRLRRVGRCVCLSVSDHGRGFDPQELTETAGFGLFSIRERIELLGGRMRIKSAKGEGSTFHIVVPDGPETEDRGRRAEERAARRTASSAFGQPSGAPVLRILLADDHEIVREGLASLLAEMPGIEVVGEAANGREAINEAYRLRPDVVIMDVAMPLINGDEATRQIKMHLPGTRVIGLSMYEEPDLMEKMRRAGAEGYILKTAPTEKLLAAIRGQ
jgi:signal transduction histidine kinase